MLRMTPNAAIVPDVPAHFDDEHRHRRVERGPCVPGRARCVATESLLHRSVRDTWTGRMGRSGRGREPRCPVLDLAFSPTSSPRRTRDCTSSSTVSSSARLPGAVDEVVRVQPQVRDVVLRRSAVEEMPAATQRGRRGDETPGAGRQLRNSPDGIGSGTCSGPGCGCARSVGTNSVREGRHVAEHAGAPRAAVAGSRGTRAWRPPSGTRCRCAGR